MLDGDAANACVGCGAEGAALEGEGKVNGVDFLWEMVLKTADTAGPVSSCLVRSTEPGTAFTPSWSVVPGDVGGGGGEGGGVVVVVAGATVRSGMGRGEGFHPNGTATSPTITVGVVVSASPFGASAVAAFSPPVPLVPSVQSAAPSKSVPGRGGVEGSDGAEGRWQGEGSGGELLGSKGSCVGDGLRGGGKRAEKDGNALVVVG